MKRLVPYLLTLCFAVSCFSFVPSTGCPVPTRAYVCLAPFLGTGIRVVFDEKGRQEIIGGGDYSVVYSADGFLVHPDGRREKKTVVIKDVVFLDVMGEAEELFDNEVAMFRMFSANSALSEFIPELYEVYRTDTVGVLIMEDLSAEENPFHVFSRANLDLCRNFEEKLLVAREVCRVFEILNNEGYVHLDVSPDNIMFRMNERPDGTRYAQVKLIDLQDIELTADSDSGAVVRQIGSLGGCFAEFFSYVDFKWMDIKSLDQLKLPADYGLDTLITFMVLPSFKDGYTSFRNMGHVSGVWDNVLDAFYSSDSISLAA